MPKLTAIFVAAYMLAVMWTFRAHGQAPDGPVAAQVQTLPRVELPAQEPAHAPPMALQGEARVEDLAHMPRWMVVGGSALITSAAIHMALLGGRFRCGGEDRRFVTPFVAGGIVVSVGAILTIAGGTRWARIDKPARATESSRLALGFGGLAMVAASQLLLTAVTGPELIGCLVSSSS